MKLCVFSDSHGCPSKMLAFIGRENPDLVIHLGDGAADFEKIKMQFPQMPIKAARGNCDYTSSLPEKDFFSVNGVGIFITHGHLYGVKGADDALLNAARCQGARLALFGHTHSAIIREKDGVCLFNPGSCGYGSSASCGLVDISDSGVFRCSIVPLS